PSSGRLFALLLYLSFRHGQSISRRVVQELLFPSSDPGHGAHSLRQLLYRLRQLGVQIEGDDDQLLLRVENVSLDWLDILSSSQLNQQLLNQLSHGFFPGYVPQFSDEFREWFEGERDEVSLRLRRYLTTQLRLLRSGCQWDLVDKLAAALLALDPL